MISIFLYEQQLNLIGTLFEANHVALALASTARLTLGMVKKAAASQMQSAGLHGAGGGLLERAELRGETM